MPPPSPSTALTFEDARHVVEHHASQLKPRGSEVLSLLDAAGRILAEPISADRDLPPFPRATRDGYAVRAADVVNVPAQLEMVGEVRAGSKMQDVPQLGARETVSIMTGAAVPDSADAIVMIEHTERIGDHVTVQRSVSAGENVVPAGAEARKCDQLLSPATRLDYAAIAMAAAVGRPRVAVYAKPRVAVLSTGDEVVDIGVSPGPNQIRNSNSYSLAAQIQSAGAQPVLLPSAPDEPHRLRELLLEGLKCDLLLIAGGVSMGKYDLVEQVLAELQAEFFFTGAQIQPGKPIVFGRLPCGVDFARGGSNSVEHKYFFGLPGNPISTMVCFELFARPVIEALAGMAPSPLIFSRAKLNKTIQTKTGLKRILPAHLSGEFEEAEVELVPWQGSGDVAAVTRSNCFIVIPPDRERVEAGEWVAVMMR